MLIADISCKFYTFQWRTHYTEEVCGSRAHTPIEEKIQNKHYSSVHFLSLCLPIFDVGLKIRHAVKCVLLTLWPIYDAEKSVRMVKMLYLSKIRSD